MAIATCAVVGAGIAGLSAAEVLGARGVTVVVLEKSLGVGGRTVIEVGTSAVREELA